MSFPKGHFFLKCGSGTCLDNKIAAQFSTQFHLVRNMLADDSSKRER